MAIPLKTTFSDLPEVVHQHIACFLDRPSAVALASTCLLLNPIGEGAAWRHVNLSLHRDTFYPGPQAMAVPVLGKERLLRIRQMYEWTPDLGEGSQAAVQPLAFADTLRCLVAHIKSHPRYLLSIRTISVDVDRLLSEPFLELLTLVGERLTRLELLPPEFAYGPLSIKGLLTTTELFDKLPRPLKALRHLHLSLPSQWQDQVSSVLSRTPYLRSLRLSPDSNQAGGWGERTLFEEATVREWPSLPLLERLEVDDVDGSLSSMLASLVSGSGRIQYIGLRDPECTWRPDYGDPLIEELGQRSEVGYLGLGYPAFDVLTKRGYVPSVERLSIIDRDVQNTLPLLQAHTIPQCSSVKELFLYGPRYTACGTATWSWSSPWQGLPSPVRGIDETILLALHSNPFLSIIHFPTCFNLDDSPSDDLAWTGSPWPGTSERVVLIRTYVNQGETFTHCRSFTSHHEHVDKGLVHEAEQVWEESTDYEGRRVGGGALAEVYMAAGEDVGWTKPGRGLAMVEEAWAILRGI
ncbi:hypothetical protein IAT38_001846 [Cryptococcus sp. DSM 104549]